MLITQSSQMISASIGFKTETSTGGRLLPIIQEYSNNVAKLIFGFGDKISQKYLKAGNFYI